MHYDEEMTQRLLAGLPISLYPIGQWLCPDLSQYSIEQDDGRGFTVHIALREELPGRLSSHVHKKELLLNSPIQLRFVSQHFEPQEYTDDQSMKFLTLTDELAIIEFETKQTTVYFIEQIKTALFNFKWLDISALQAVTELFDISWGKEILTYKVGKHSHFSVPSPISSEINITFKQAKTVHEQEFSIESLDVMLGLIGGYTALLWGVLGYCMNGYEGFKYNNSVIGAIYNAYPTGGPGKEPAASFDEAAEFMERDVQTGGKFDYGYMEYWRAWVLSICCCCCRSCRCCKTSIKRFENYEDAREKFKDELDVTRILNAVRMAEFMSMITLKKYQRHLVNHFRRY